MIYPKFLKENGTIGITALSAGIKDDLKQYELIHKNFNNLGVKIIETKDVSSTKAVSASAKTRAKELDELINNEEVEVIYCASGGDYQVETVPYINYDNIVKHPKWICGYSDPTNLLYVLTTKYDIATMYGYNASAYCTNKPQKYTSTTFEYLKGHITKQNSYPKYGVIDFVNGDKYNPKFTVPTNWITNGDCKVTGRLIGGCFDVLDVLCGTKYDNTANFVEKYKDDGIIWAFDDFAISSFNFYLGLWKMKENGWFKYTKAVILGRVCFEKVETDVDYQKAIEKIFGKKIPIIRDACIGHVTPCMTLVLGALATVTTNGNKGSISFELK